ncbi:MAG: MMPL family transporter [Alphaproteobacteria bacterium]|nr:MMPL family transporter [Alphaproteobacteria bacterium]
MKSFIRLILSASVDKPFWVVAVFAPLLLLAVTGLFRIDFEDGLRTMFTSSSEAFEDYAAYSHAFAQSETDVAVLVSAPDPLGSAGLTTLQNFILEAQFIDGIGGVYSIFSLSKRDPETGELVRLLPSDLTDQPALDLAIKLVADRTASGISLLSEDGRETVVAFSMGADMADMAGSSGTLHNLENLARDMSVKGGIQFAITGLIPIRESIIAGLKRDQMKINVLGAFLGFLVSLALFRSFWIAFINTVTPVTALIFCLGAFGWLGLSINALTNALPVLILVLASSDSIHLTFEIRRRMGRGEGRIDAIRGALVDIAPPVVLTSLTTMLAFASLFYSSSPIVQDLALAGTAGVFLAMLVVLFVHPVVFMIAGRFSFVAKVLPLVEKPNAGKRKRMFAVRNFRAVSLGGIALTLAALFILWPIQPAYRFLENIDEDQPVVQILQRVEALSGPINNINIPLTLKTGVAITDQAVFDDLAKLHAAVAPLGGIRAVVSLNNLKELVSDSAGRIDTAALTRLLEQMPERFRSRLIGLSGSDLQLVALVPDKGSQVTDALAAAIERTVQSLDLQALTAGRPTGFLVMSSALTDDMIKQLTISFLIAALACPALIGFWYRRLDFGLAAIVPNILPIILSGAVLTALDFDIQITSALALTIAFGIALDDSIHVFNRLHLQMRQDGQAISGPLVAHAMSQVRPILIVTTIILSAGLLATLVSEMPMIRFFGLLCMATFVLALISDIVLLPAIITWFAKDRT